MARTKRLNEMPKLVLSAKNEAQKQVIRTIRQHDITFIYGPAGSGKTHLPVIYGLQELQKERYERLIFTRPCVEAHGEQLGFLPGDFNEKIAPYMIPIFDILNRSVDKKEISALVSEEKIQTIPLAFQRGVTFQDAFVVLDEAQNTIPPQMRMFLTRMGENCKIVVTGDPNQNDIEVRNGLVDAIERFADVEEIGIVEMTHRDIVRNPLVELIDKKYIES